MKMLIAILFLTNLATAQTFVDPKTNAIKEEPIGKVTKVVGRMIRIPFKNRSIEEPLKLDDQIIQGDIIKTSEKSIGRFQMKDDTSLTLGPESEFEFTKYTEDESGKRKATYNFLLGHLRAKVTKPAEPGALEFKMRKVSMGIRGTEIIAEIVLDKANNYITKVLLSEGKAFVDLTQLNMRTLKDLNLDIGKILDTARAKLEAKAPDLLIPLTDAQFKKLLTMKDNDYKFPFLKDMNNPDNDDEDKGNQLMSGDASLDAAEPKKPGLYMDKQKKNWKEILDENQKTKKSRKKIVEEDDN